jgi:hypothetical protein
MPFSNRTRMWMEGMRRAAGRKVCSAFEDSVVGARAEDAPGGSASH